ncbi:MAG TPA: hypothetical protein PLS03_12740, partial [Terrimicrobiaceae bacterium]|nr:hypothetical protein [Terrimicrobiaceae bacterium]
MESPGSVLALRDGALAIETNDDASAWIELPVALPEPGARFVVEVDADAASQPGAAAIQIASGEKGVFSWLFDKTHLRVCTDAKNNHEYTAMDVTARHVYRYEIDGLDVVVSVDGNQVYSGRLDEPLIDPVLSIGDLSPGGGRMRVYRIEVESGASKKSGGAGTAASVRIVRWTGPLEPGGRWEQSWPEKADAIVMEAAYVAAAARQAQFYFLCEGEFGQRMVTAASGLASIAASDVREEKLFLKIPSATRKISLVWTASDSVVPFSMRSLGLIPVRTLAGNPHFERIAGWPDGSIGQSFLLEGRERLLGFAIPLVRCFDARAIRAQLSCTVSGDGLSERKFVQPAANIPQDYLGSAVFL